MKLCSGIAFRYIRLIGKVCVSVGDMSSECARAMLECLSYDESGEVPRAVPQMVNIVKLYPRPDCSGFDAFGRVLSGVVRVGDRVRVLREGECLTPFCSDLVLVLQFTVTSRSGFLSIGLVSNVNIHCLACIQKYVISAFKCCCVFDISRL